MKFSVAAVLAVASGAMAHYNVSYTTEVVTAYTTYCPGPTEIVHGDKTYTITSATTLTITDCPCTISKPVITTSAVVCATGCGKSNVTMTTVPSPPAATSTKAPVTAGAAKDVILSGGALAGLVGAAALLL